MGFLRKRRRPPGEPDPVGSSSDQDASDGASRVAPQTAEVGYNPKRDDRLFWLTDEGYIIAQDVVCQHEYIEASVCPECGAALVVVAHLNRAGQGLSEFVTLCRNCRTRSTFIFDISNTVYQAWWAEQLGPLYLAQYDGPPREPVYPA